MRDWTGPEADTSPGVSGVPSVTDVRALPGYRLWVRFVDGTEGEVDVSNLVLPPTAGVFAPLRDPARFAEAHVDDGAVTWPCGLDLARDAMYDEIRAHGRWSIPPFPHPVP
jgi:CubicO group peptidase (beta-lactamase class C family)